MSKWQIIYSMIENLPVNSLVTYEEICEALQIFDIDSCRGYFFRAVKELEVEQQRTMENVRGTGYRVVEAREHERLVKKDVRSIKRKTRKAVSKAVNVRREELSPEE